MTTTVTNYGDNLGIQFPKSLWKGVHIFENDNVEISIKDNIIMIKRQGNKMHRTTEERIIDFYGEKAINADQSQLSEFDWGKPQGREISHSVKSKKFSERSYPLRPTKDTGHLCPQL